MVNKRQFFSILLMVVALLTLFQGPQIIRQDRNRYSQNVHLRATALNEDTVWRASENSRYAVYLGASDGDTGKTAEEWAFYTKRNLVTAQHLSEYQPSESHLPDLVMIDATALPHPCDTSAIRRILDLGVPVVLMNLPPAGQVKEDEPLQSLLDIYYIRQETVHADGIHLYKGLLLGGERVYQEEKGEEKLQDLDLDVPWYVPSAGSRTFLSAIITPQGNETLDNKDMPSLLWRVQREKSMLYVISGAFMNDRLIGIGILDGIMSDCSEYDIYPVVNAQNLVISGLPELSDENDETMREIYGRSQTDFEKNVILPAIESLCRRTGDLPTAMAAAGYDYADGTGPSGNPLTFYLRQLREENGEAGVCLLHAGTTDTSAAAGETFAALGSLSDGYAYGAAQIDSSDIPSVGALLDAAGGGSIRTVLSDYSGDRPVLAWVDTGRTLQPLLSDAASHTFRTDLELLGVQTALAYSTTGINLLKTLWPEDVDDRWERMAEEVFGNLETYWEPFQTFDKTTLSESDARIRTALSVDYQDTLLDADGNVAEDFASGGQTIRLAAGSFEGTAYFILRMHGQEVTGVRGGTCEKIEDGAWLLGLQDAQAEISVRKEGMS